KFIQPHNVIEACPFYNMIQTATTWLIIDLTIGIPISTESVAANVSQPLVCHRMVKRKPSRGENIDLLINGWESLDWLRHVGVNLLKRDPAHTSRGWAGCTITPIIPSHVRSSDPPERLSHQAAENSPSALRSRDSITKQIGNLCYK